ncbi:MAG: hypothetical protein IJT36_07605 [Alphaproteobacteria bacterium]|nr:hypothetical protein [Alphaproteobacteria bacterium]
MNDKYIINENLLSCIIETSCSVVSNILHKIIDNDINANNLGYISYPEQLFESMKDSEEFSKLQTKFNCYKYDIPNFQSSEKLPQKDYFSFISSLTKEKSSDINSLVSLFDDDDIAKNRLEIRGVETRTGVVFYINNIVKRYFYLTKTNEVNSDLVNKLVTCQIIRMFCHKLYFSIYVPMCFLIFDKQEIDISPNIKIIQMPLGFQKSRYFINGFNSEGESGVIKCAKFALKLENYSVDNDNIDSWYNTIKSCGCYPLELIDDLFASIRIVTGYNSGYGQLLIEPDKWAGEWTADLQTLYGTNIRAFNLNETTKSFEKHEINILNSSQISRIKTVFNKIREYRTLTDKKTNYNPLFLALKRLNRCILRQDEDDAIFDATIGIEILLNLNILSEITYRIQNRITIVSKKVDICHFTSTQCRMIMKKIYDYRSGVAHGNVSKIDKNKVITLNGIVYNTLSLAISLLRFSLLFVIENPEYLADWGSKYEEDIDNALYT